HYLSQISGGKYTERAYFGLREVLQRLSEFSGRLEKIIKGATSTIESYEKSLRWELPTRGSINFKGINTVGLDFAAETADSPLLLNKMAFKQFQSILACTSL
ncbi:Hypothetical protein FKW44_018035, partial [Caligus rogercresseyi]